MDEPRHDAPAEEGNDQVVSTDVTPPAPEELEYIPEDGPDSPPEDMDDGFTPLDVPDDLVEREDPPEGADD